MDYSTVLGGEEERLSAHPRYRVQGDQGGCPAPTGSLVERRRRVVVGSQPIQSVHAYVPVRPGNSNGGIDGGNLCRRDKDGRDAINGRGRGDRANHQNTRLPVEGLNSYPLPLQSRTHGLHRSPIF